MANENVRVWICTDCDFIFQTYSHVPTQGKRYPFYCPNCGDNLTVRKYKAVKKKRGTTRRFWTDEELEIVKDVMDGKLMIYQAAVKLNRTNKAVRRRVDRMKEEADFNKLTTIGEVAEQFGISFSDIMEAKKHIDVD